MTRILIRGIVGIIFFVFIFVSFFSISLAKEVRSNKSIVLSKDDVVDKDYFAAGESVTLSGTVNGDAYLAGGNVIVEGTVNGDLLAAGGVVNVRGTISQDLRLIGGQVNVSGNVGGNVTTAGGSVTITDSAQVSGSLVSGSGALSIFGPIGKGATIGAGSLNIGNFVGGDILASVGKLALTPRTNIQGDLTYFSDGAANIQKGATISGAVEFKKYPIFKKEIGDKAVREKVRRVFGQSALLLKILYLSSLFLAGLIFLKFLPIFTKNAVDLIQAKLWVSMGIGLLTLIVTPFVVLLLFMTVIGIPFALLLFFLYFAFMYFGKVFVAIFVGQKLNSYFTKDASPFLALLTGLIVYGILLSIPFIGWLIKLLALLVGLGMLVIDRKNFYLTLRNKKMI